ncbi:CHASE2 domain-containing protein [Alsobacter sp. R-9]
MSVASSLSRRRLPVLAALATLMAIVGVRAADPGIVSGLRNLTFDAYQRLKPREYGDPAVRVVAIDDDALAALGQWPWPRTRMAELTQSLVDLGAAAVGFAVLFSEPDRLSPAQMVRQLPADVADRPAVKAVVAELPDADEAFAATLRTTPSILAFATTGEPNTLRPQVKTRWAYASADPARLIPPFAGTTPPLPLLEQGAKGIGATSLRSGGISGGVVRRVPLYVSDGKTLFPSFPVEALRVAQGARTLVIRGTGASGEFGAGRTSLIDTRIGDVVVPMTGDGEFWVYYDRTRPERRISARDVLDTARRADLASRVDGQIVVVGLTAAGLGDSWGTALGESIPGVDLQAQVLEQMVQGSFLTRYDWADGLETVATLVLGLVVLGLTLAFGPALSLAVGTVAAGAAFAASWVAFSQASLLFDPVYPALGALATHLAVTGGLFVTTDRDRRFVRQAFGQYLAPQLLAELEKAPDRMVLGGEIRPLTIMFMDVRDFTPISESISATELVGFLNSLLSPLSDAIQAQGGTIDKYIGDSIMAFWNAPLDVPDHAARACRAALAMRSVVREMNAADAFGFRAAGRTDLAVKIGIGINTGEACVGNMGSQRRFNYSAVGDAVNVAARIESASKGFATEILVSEATVRQAPGFAVLDVDAVPLKGKSAALRLYALYGDETVAGTPAFKALQADHDAMMTAWRAGRFQDAIALARACETRAAPEFAAFYASFAARLAEDDASGMAVSRLASGG